MPNPIDVRLCLPHRAKVLKRHERSLDLFRKKAPDGVSLISHTLEDHSLVHMARSILATETWKEGGEIFVWVDDDVEFWESAWWLVHGALETRSFVCAPVAIRGGSRQNTVFADGVTEVDCFLNGRRYPILSTGFGIVAIHRDVMTAVAAKLEPLYVHAERPPCIPFFDTLKRDMGAPHKNWLGEDQSFCVLAREAGFTIWADTRVRSKHWTPHGHTLEDVAHGLPHDGAELKLKVSP